jgi:hypothetical protein
VATYEGLYGFYQARYEKLVQQVNYLDAITQLAPRPIDASYSGDNALSGVVNDL